jgi:hypothetical protein
MQHDQCYGKNTTELGHGEWGWKKVETESFSPDFPKAD